jgi:hypothetical protein
MTDDSPKPPASPEGVRHALRVLQADILPAEREFAARLHRRLVAAGPPPAAAWFARVRELWQETWGGRPVLMGAMLGSLVTGAVFTLLTGTQAGREVHPTATRTRAEERVRQAAPPVAPTIPDHKAPRTVGDRRLVRDRPAEEVGAERAERAERPRTRFERR